MILLIVRGGLLNMKKKNRILSIFASVFGVFSICSLFCLSVLFHNNEVSIVNADDESTTLTIYTSSASNHNLQYISDSARTINLLYDYAVNYTFNKSSGEYLLFWSVDWCLEFNDTVNYKTYRIDYDGLGNKFHFERSIVSNSQYPVDYRIYYELTRIYPRTASFIPPYFMSLSYESSGGYTYSNNSSEVWPSINGVKMSKTDANSYFPYFQVADGSVVIFDLSLTYDNSVSTYLEAYNDGFNNGYESGYSGGFNDGYNSGYTSGYNDGVASQVSIIQNAYQEGRTDGYNEGFNADSTAITIMTGIFQVALVPINFFLGMFNFNILGINLATLIQAIFTLAVTVILIKAVIGGKGDK